MDLSLSTHTSHIGAIVDLVLAAREECDYRAFVLTPADPIPPRTLGRADGEAIWVQDAPTFAKVSRVSNWGWLRRHSGELVHPAVGTAFTVRTWRYGKSRSLGMGGTGPTYLPHERFSGCVFIARLEDGRYFADMWADRSVLHDALTRWRNARGYLVDWQETGMSDPPTCAIGSADWKAIPATIKANRDRQRAAA